MSPIVRGGLAPVAVLLALALDATQPAQAQSATRVLPARGAASAASEAPVAPRSRAPDTPVERPPISAPLPMLRPRLPPPLEPWQPAAGNSLPMPADVPRQAPPLLAPVMPPAAVPPESEHEPGQLLVLWTSLAEAQNGLVYLQQQYQLAPRQRHVLENLGVVVALLVLPGDAEARALRERLRAERPAWVVDLNARARPLEGAPRLYAQQMLGVASAPAGGRNAVTESALRVGVVDTAVSPQLLQPGALNGSVVRTRSVLEPGERAADPAHGDALLQLIAGAEQPSSFAGAAPPVELFWASAMRDQNGSAASNSLLVAQALDWLVGERVVLVNLSVGGAGDAILRAIVGRVLAARVAIVAAAGNNPAPSAAPTYPAAYPGVWAATAVDVAGRLYAGATRARYAMLAAPGVEVWVPAREGGVYVSGTSYAAALATATLAWLPAEFWKLAVAERAAEVCARARKLEANGYLGCGLVQKRAGGP